jgi:hypothetical protein
MHNLNLHHKHCRELRPIFWANHLKAASSYGGDEPTRHKPTVVIHYKLPVTYRPTLRGGTILDTYGTSQFLYELNDISDACSGTTVSYWKIPVTNASLDDYTDTILL